MGIRNAQVRSLGDMMASVLDDLGLTKCVDEATVEEIWSDVVGKPFADRTVKVECREGVLYVKCSSSIVAKELSLRKEGLMYALNKKIGKKFLNRIVITS